MAPGDYVVSPGSDAANEQESDFEEASDSGSGRGGGGAAAAPAAAAAAAANDSDDDDDEYYYDDDASDAEHFPSRFSGLECDCRVSVRGVCVS